MKIKHGVLWRLYRHTWGSGEPVTIKALVYWWKWVKRQGAIN